MNESRPNTIWRHVHSYVRETTTSWYGFAANVAKIYFRAVPEAQRTVQFHTGTRGKDSYESARRDAQILRRMEEHGEMPGDLEEALVAALPEDRQEALLQELARRYGLLAAPIPTHTSEGTAVSLAEFVGKTGRAIEAVAPMLDDNKIDADDAHMAVDALDEIDAVMAALTTLRARTKKVAPDRTVCVEHANRLRSKAS